MNGSVPAALSRRMITPEESGIEGVFAAAVTPMTDDGEAVALGSVGPLLAHLESKGLDGALVMGTTGEFASLAFSERLELFSEASATKGKMKLVAGCASSSLKEVLELLDLAGRKGAVAALVSPPFYFRNATEKGLETFFERVLERARIPVLLYHIPAYTGIALGPEMLERLARFPTLWGIKDSGGNLRETSRFLSAPPARVMLGSDSLMLSSLKLGTKGVITACANIAPKLMKELYEKFRAGGDAEALQEKLSAVRKILSTIPVHAALKTLLAIQGISVGGVRPPAVPLTEKERDFLSQEALLLGLISG